jgi:NAD(P)-dependent dehydrogenase (short-subunit alcohol dehydrogenase family)
VLATVARTSRAMTTTVAAAGQAVERAFGKLHVCVNNAGVAMHGTPVEQVKPEEWNWVIGGNVLGVINGIRAFVPMIRSHGAGGHVVNTASISGLFPRAGQNQGAYSMTKYAVVGLSEALEQELTGSGIGISVLSRRGADVDFRVRSDTAGEVRRSLSTAGARGAARRVFSGVARPGGRGTARAASDPRR